VHLSLRSRRGILAEVLGALQRMGLSPPPALLVRPEDALASVRSAILLGAVVPEIRAETETLMADLDALRRISASIVEERERLAGKVALQVEEKERLQRLLAEKEKLRAVSETELAEERRRADALVARAGSLEELIRALEKEIEAQMKAEEERRKRETELASLPVPQANRLARSLPFGRLVRSLPLPAAGRIVHRFGAPDSLGVHRNGDTVQTQSGAIVTAPCDAVVLYSGPFRSYGQLLILDAGDGYHVVMAGLDRINVGLGQAVLAGEPVGAMGEVRLASAAAADGENVGPALYIEFRKDGKPVDPAPWWADRESGRTGNDS
jgi:septal ring factor EnvC (AmiA/AmiB activator)